MPGLIREYVWNKALTISFAILHTREIIYGSSL